MAIHPLSDLTATELKQAASLVRALYRGQQLVFKAITLEEPPKELVLRYFKAEENGTPLPVIPRTAFAAYYLKGTVSGTNDKSHIGYLVALADTSTLRIISSRLLSTSQRI